MYARRIILIIVAAVATTYLSIFLYLHQQYSTPKTDKPRILLLWAGGMGEKEQVQRTKIAAEKMGIQYTMVSIAEQRSFAGRLLPDIISTITNIYQPDLILTIQQGIKHYPQANNFRVLDGDLTNYVGAKSNGDYYLTNNALLEFEVMLPSFKEIDALKIAYEKHKPFRGFIWYPTMYKTTYQPQKVSRLLYTGGSGPLRNSPKYHEALALLDQQPYFELTANEKSLNKTLQAYRPSIPFDGVSLIKEYNVAGAALILHKERHLKSGVPSGRIFEAAAANALIISDKNQFIIDNFGDNVLYIDVDQQPTEIFAQIDRHMQWAFANPEAAAQKADNCHKIFMTRFALEDQIQKLIEFNKSI